MAWRCVRCDKKIFAPRRDNCSYALEWTFTSGLLSTEVRRLSSISDNAVISHLTCEGGSAEFGNKLRYVLKIPDNIIHPLLD